MYKKSTKEVTLPDITKCTHCFVCGGETHTREINKTVFYETLLIPMPDKINEIVGEVTSKPMMGLYHDSCLDRVSVAFVINGDKVFLLKGQYERPAWITLNIPERYL